MTPLRVAAIFLIGAAIGLMLTWLALTMFFPTTSIDSAILLILVGIVIGGSLSLLALKKRNTGQTKLNSQRGDA